MNIEFFKASELERNVKCSIHKSGKLGFSRNAISKLKLDSGMSLQIGKNAEDESDDNLYMNVLSYENLDAFKIIKAGDYYYANTKALFDQLQIDYKRKTIIYDIVEMEINERKIYKLMPREKDKK